eukprot:CAMPEP_0114283614 /NCGR_PEP_ID=MMETSP0059-20121206/4199_1 /TAXON_ID=36894 /ORGANISM="Pyramimonas parkeae, Strain CCMP726" /LENGTH=68 /DNA_ID=CAMNT_0001404361 /DNA_START=1192 /DNA_END=1395 /DNA_ORIENTATION=+
MEEAFMARAELVRTPLEAATIRTGIEVATAAIFGSWWVVLVGDLRVRMVAASKGVRTNSARAMKASSM